MPDPESSPSAFAGRASPSVDGISVRRNILFAIAGTGILNLGRLAVVSLLAKCTSPEILGRYNYSTALAVPIVLCLTLQIRTAYVSDASGTFTLGTYRALRTLSAIVAALVFLALILWELLIEERLAFVLIFAGVCAARVIWSLSEICWGVFQKRERLDLAAWSNVWRGVTVVLPFAVLLPLVHALSAEPRPSHDTLASWAAAAVLLHAAGWWVVFAAFDRPRAARLAVGDSSWNWAGVGRLAAQTFPLGVVMLIITLCDSIPQLIIAAQPNGNEHLGYFGALFYIAAASSLVILQTGQAIAYRLAIYFQNNLPAFVRLTGKFVALAGGIGVVVYVAARLIGRWFLTVVYGPEYAEYFSEFLVLVLAYCLLLPVYAFGIAITHMRLFWVQVPMQVAVLGTTIVAALLLIPSDPIGGAAWTALVRAGVQAGLYGVCLVAGVWRQHLRVKRGSATGAPRSSAKHDPT